MHHKKQFFLLTLTAAIALSGCGSKKNSETEQPAPSADGTLDTEESSEASEELAPITPSDYLIQNVSDYITLASLDGLSATQTTYEITDDMVQSQISDELYMYSEEKEVEKAAEGSTVYADVTSSIQGTDGSESEESTFFTIGDEDYGPEFDAQLIGRSVGDEMSFSVSYDDDTWFEDWSGKTVDFTVNVTGVYETVVPEYTDEFVTEYTDYSSKEEYEESLREMLEDDYTQESYSDTVNSLLQTVTDQSVFNGYPEELYNSCEEEILSYYGQFLGTDDRTEIMDSLGITEEDLKSDILNAVNLRLVVSAICEEKDLEVTEDEYVSEVTAMAEDLGYLSAAEYEEANTREATVWTLYENKAAEFLYDNAEITPVEATEEDLADDDFWEEDTEEETFGTDEIFAAELTEDE